MKDKKKKKQTKKTNKQVAIPEGGIIWANTSF